MSTKGTPDRPEAARPEPPAPPAPSAATPWYGDGLRFQCTACGDCCTGAPGYVWVNKSEIADLAALVGLSVPLFEQRYVRKVGIRKSLLERRNGDCVFFDPQSRRCEVYGARPQQCRTWPFWESNLRTAGDWELTSRACPGCNQGKLYSLQEIQSRVDAKRV